MAPPLPERLKKVDLHRFAMRAAQLEKARPIVSYWCEYYLLQQVLGKQLHLNDDACSDYAVQLMDKLESTKAANSTNDAISDDVAAKAYIENFALDTFSRADDSQRANKVTKQTADTFMAAAAFIDLLDIWGEVDREVTSKSKYAKYHARRILLACKNGEDPNATNPVVEEPRGQQPPPVDDALEAELKAMEDQQNGGPSSTYRSPTVENAEGQPPADPQPLLDDDVPAPPTIVQLPSEVSPLEPTANANNSRQNSIGGGYFPTADSTSLPREVDMTDPATTPQAPPPTPPDLNPQDFYNTTAPAPTSDPSAPSPRALGISSPARPSRPIPPDVASPLLPTTLPPAALEQPLPPSSTIQAPPPTVSHATTALRSDDEAIMAAQKHARWAISALNFEDAPTAVKELRLALQSLGAG